MIENISISTIIDSEYTIIFVSKEITKKASLNIKLIALKRVYVADRHILIAIEIVIFEMKLENLLIEIITAYIFSLRRIRLVLELL
jgi:hypothetical protein